MSSCDLLIQTSSTTVTPSRQEKARSWRQQHRLIQAFRDWYDAYRRRQVLLDLLRYDDHMLDDMGHNREDILAIANLPLSADAHEVLRQLKELRSDRNGKRVAR
ncbi:hypothetical protein [Amphritea pacifica]|uniref:DUF1127 domain-containing protein n=1 Tax=Amphritea pacifica TaxID=2811233 RepID=A0ABS2WA81_9GAMM|nr:hypothetical protein [Amphritea pacifica]MBN0988491.1 hypothetical protein [Amphritea pacifica]MBN1007961.1 hypothetical protein [Amphritea pacifica]